MGTTTIRAAMGAAIDLVLPRTCAGCGGAGAALCPACRHDLADLALVETGPVAPSPVPAEWPGCTGTVRYGEVAARLMRAFKDEDRIDLLDPLSRLLTDAVRRALDQAPFVGTERTVLIVPIPSSPAATRHRGTRPTLLLARRAARAIGPGVRLAPVLTMARGTEDQAGLDRERRQDNLHGAMRVRSPQTVQGRDCVLVDDVLTSGATLSEGRRALRHAGAGHVGMAVCMVTVRRSLGVALPFRAAAD